MKALKTVGIIIFILVAGLLAVTLSIDGIVKSGIEENGSELLQTEVDVDDVDISIFDGTGTIGGFEVENPEGFSDAEAVRFEEATLKIDLASIFSDQIIVKELTIKSPELFFEQQGIGANLKKLNDNMDIASEGSSGKSLIVDHLLITDGLVKVSTDIDRERNARVSIDQFELTGIGREGSDTVKETVRQIMEPLLEKAIAEAVSKGLIEQLGDKAKELIDG